MASRANPKRSFRFLQGPIGSLVMAALFLFAALVASLHYDRLEKYNAFSQLVPGHLSEAMAFLLVFSAGAVVGLVCFVLAQPGWRENVGCFWVPVRRTGILIGGTATLLLSLFVWWGSATMSDEKVKVSHLVQHDPGGIFAAFMGLVTIIGFAFTLHDLREMRRRITSFPDLIDRLTAMLSRKGKEDIRFLAYTPALGYIALEEAEFRTFYDAVRRTGADSMPRLDMTCLNKKDLEEWHDLFIGRRTRRKRFERAVSFGDESKQKTSTPGFVDPPLAKAATRMGEHIVEGLLRERELEPAEEAAPRLKRLPFEFLPGYYFFVSPDRAIVAAPLQLPFPKGTPRVAQQSNRTVQMLGFETNDRAIIHDLIDLYDSYKTLPSSYVAECSDTMSADRLAAWLRNEAPDAGAAAREPAAKAVPEAPKTTPQNGPPPRFGNSQEALTEVLRQFHIASGIATEKDTEPAAGALRDDYRKFIDPNALNNSRLEVMFRVSLKQEAQSS